MTPTYDIHKTYDENYDNGPYFSGSVDTIIINKPIKLWGHTINSPLGIPAGPLLNAKYINLYAKLGFDLPVYKTVRTIQRNSHPKPNCMLVDRENSLSESDVGKQIQTAIEQDADKKSISITNSFGIPSKPVEIWQSDIEKANNTMGENQLMIVSCVGTPLPKRNIIEDYALCAKLAVEAGAKAIELNFSCPNVTSKEGCIYQDAELSSTISKAVKKSVKDVPLMIKIGYISNLNELERIVQANAPHVEGIAAINTITMQAVDQNGKQALPGNGRLNSGICGKIIKDIGLQMTKNLHQVKQKNNYDYIICGVGGITTPEDFNAYLNAGANIVMSATGAMWNPYLAMEWRNQYA